VDCSALFEGRNSTEKKETETKIERRNKTVKGRKQVGRRKVSFRTSRDSENSCA
jgi:hypothetical protein